MRNTKWHSARDPINVAIAPDFKNAKMTDRAVLWGNFSKAVKMIK